MELRWAPLKVKGNILNSVFMSMTQKEWFIYYDAYCVIAG